MPFSSPGNNLQTIMQKVRRLTRTPSQAQLDDNTLVDYINTFILYDFPEHLRTFNFRVQFTFVCNPFQDLYYTDIAGYGGASNAQANQLYDFQNNYLTIHPPVYIAGYQSFYTQSREQFFGIYPIVNNIQLAGNGDSVTTNFVGVIDIVNQGIINNVVQGTSQGGAVLLKNQVLFDSIDVNGNGLSMIDSPILDSVTGNPTVWGILYPANNPPATTTILCAPPYNDITVNPQFTPYQANFINYLTGQFSVTFPTAPIQGAPVNSQTVPLVASMPQALLFYQNRMIVRPIPDQPYRINFEAYVFRFVRKLGK